MSIHEQWNVLCGSRQATSIVGTGGGCMDDEDSDGPDENTIHIKSVQSCRHKTDRLDASTLYTFVGSGNSYKVRLLEALLGIELKHVELDFLADEQHQPKFLAINPRGEVPCLVDGDKVFNDSSSILTWLAGKWNDTGKAEGPSSYWSGELWVQYGVFTNRAILSYNGPYNGLGNNQQWPQEKLDVFLEEGEIRGKHSLQVLDAQLEKNDWLVLGRPTIADISVFVYISLAEMGDISLKPYPNVLAWIERIKKLPRFFAIEGLDEPLLHIERWKSAGRIQPKNFNTQRYYNIVFIRSVAYPSQTSYRCTPAVSKSCRLFSDGGAVAVVVVVGLPFPILCVYNAAVRLHHTVYSAVVPGGLCISLKESRKRRELWLLIWCLDEARSRDM
nr:protein gsta [Quercus suber]